MADILDDETGEEMVAQKDWSKTENDARKTGYRLGLSMGEEESLQQGFDAGYPTAVKMAFAIGRLQGQISASLSVVEGAAVKGEGEGESSRLTTQLTELLNDCAHVQQSMQTLQYRDVPESPLNCAQSTYSNSHPLQTAPVNPTHRPCPQSPAETGEDMECVTDLFTAMDVQDLSLSSCSDFSKYLGELQQRYQILLEHVNNC